jgi:hypothetical protein
MSPNPIASMIRYKFSLKERLKFMIKRFRRSPIINNIGKVHFLLLGLYYILILQYNLRKSKYENY